MKAAAVREGLEVQLCANPRDGGTLTGKTRTWAGDEREWGWITWMSGLETWVDLALVKPVTDAPAKGTTRTGASRKAASGKPV